MERETSDGGPYQRPEWSVCGAGDGDGRRLVVGLFHEYLSKELTFFFLLLLVPVGTAFVWYLSRLSEMLCIRYRREAQGDGAGGGGGHSCRLDRYASAPLPVPLFVSSHQPPPPRPGPRPKTRPKKREAHTTD